MLCTLIFWNDNKVKYIMWNNGTWQEEAEDSQESFTLQSQLLRYSLSIYGQKLEDKH